MAYSVGRGVAQNHAEAFVWFSKAAQAGDAAAQGHLALSYMRGLGVPQDYVEAHAWYNLAATNGEPEFLKARDALASKMGPEQIARAQQLARERFDSFRRGPFVGSTTDESIDLPPVGSGVSANETGQVRFERLEPVATKLTPSASLERDPSPSSAEVPDLQVGATFDEFEFEEARSLAESGDSAAQLDVARMYENGRGVPRDHVLAYAWATLASRHGEPGAEEKRRELAELLNQLEIEVAESMASDYLRKLEDR